MDWSHIQFAMFHTKVQHSDHTEYQHYEDRCSPLRVYKDHAELRIPQGLVRYELNPEFIEKLNLRFYPNRDARFDRYKISI